MKKEWRISHGLLSALPRVTSAHSSLAKPVTWPHLVKMLEALSFPDPWGREAQVLVISISVIRRWEYRNEWRPDLVLRDSKTSGQGEHVDSNRLVLQSCINYKIHGVMATVTKEEYPGAQKCRIYLPVLGDKRKTSGWRWYQRGGWAVYQVQVYVTLVRVVLSNLCMLHNI